MIFLKKIFGQHTEEPVEKSAPLETSEEQVEVATESKPVENIKSFQTKVAGVSFARRQSYLKRMRKIAIEDTEFISISLIREPNNKHDSNAIKVVWYKYDERSDEEKEYHLGYIKAQVAGGLADNIDGLAGDMDKGKIVTAYFEEILGGYYDEEEDYGLLITVDIEQEVI